MSIIDHLQHNYLLKQDQDIENVLVNINSIITFLSKNTNYLTNQNYINYFNVYLKFDNVVIEEIFTSNVNDNDKVLMLVYASHIKFNIVKRLKSILQRLVLEYKNTGGSVPNEILELIDTQQNEKEDDNDGDNYFKDDNDGDEKEDDNDGDEKEDDNDGDEKEDDNYDDNDGDEKEDDTGNISDEQPGSDEDVDKENDESALTEQEILELNNINEYMDDDEYVEPLTFQEHILNYLITSVHIYGKDVKPKSNSPRDTYQKEAEFNTLWNDYSSVQRPITKDDAKSIYDLNYNKINDLFYKTGTLDTKNNTKTFKTMVKNYLKQHKLWDPSTGACKKNFIEYFKHTGLYSNLRIPNSDTNILDYVVGNTYNDVFRYLYNYLKKHDVKLIYEYNYSKFLQGNGLNYLYNLVTNKDWNNISTRTISKNDLCWNYNTELYNQLK